MAGDKVDINTFYYYTTTPTAGNNTHQAVNTLITDVLTGFFGAGTVNNLANKFTPAQNGDAAFGNNPLFSDWLTTNTTTPGTNLANKPKAYLNYVLFDDQFKLVQSFSTAKQVNVQGSYTNNNTSVSGITMPRNGYLYVYTSNEAAFDVFFDSLQIKHYTGPLIEETHYNAWGLTLAGISSVAIKPKYTENKYLFNGGNELQSKEFSDGSGLDWYDATFRMYDPQIGRFHQIDMLADISENWSPYAFAYNNPILFNDPLGLLSDSAHPQVLPEVIVRGTTKKQPPGYVVPTINPPTGGPSIARIGPALLPSAAAAAETAAATTTAVETAPVWAPAIIPLAIVGGIVGLDMWLSSLSHPVPYMPRSTGDIASMATRIHVSPLAVPAPTQNPNFTGIPSVIDPWGEQYTLRARISGLYPRFEWGKGQTGLKFLSKGDIWKIGTTTKGQRRYSGPFYSNTGPGLLYLAEFEGPMSQVLFVEKMKLLNYINQHKETPPGNTKLQ